MEASSSLKLGSLKKSPQHLEAADRVKEWTRERFSLPEDAAILVTELTCTIQGCPPLETVVAFWSDHKTRHDFKIFKPIVGDRAGRPAPRLAEELSHFRGRRHHLRLLLSRLILRRRMQGAASARGPKDGATMFERNCRL